METELTYKSLNRKAIYESVDRISTNKNFVKLILISHLLIKLPQHSIETDKNADSP